ncbi:MAG: 4-hydroxybenzoate octaprenyltransferase [Sulfuriferula multivorans]|uniref:4-hydroxybenzoate octaprenyltransferase n=1 Tax=Sulfuriferula multivorans TaxID=1559896 RepID=A0A7C9P9H7_9PROT|nr:4-hydroxybenzoate octaprenyltransferase [Sulfuriferula multivorans]
MTLTERLSHYEKLMRLDKPIGILLLLWPTLWAQWLATNGQPNWMILWIFIMGVVLMRSAGCVINDYADRHIDSQVARTRNRPLAAGKVSAKEALLLAAGLSLLAFLLILPLNTLVLGLSVIALFLAASYPFTKRFFALPQAYLGIAFGFGIPMSYAALWGEVPMEAWILLTANTFWAIAYDTQYAMVDREDDLKIGIKTSAITFGRFDLVAIAVCYGLTLALLAWVGLQRNMGFVFYGGLITAAAIALYHMSLIRSRDPQQCFRAFLHNTWFGAAIFVGIALSYV